MKRREFLKKHAVLGGMLLGGMGVYHPSIAIGREQDEIPNGFKPIFDGKTLTGWHATPRGKPKQQPPNTGRFEVVDGVLIGGQEPPGSGIGAYLVSDDTFGDFELLIDAKPDWPADTGILVRCGSGGAPGYQIQIDHRKSGAIGGFYGNGGPLGTELGRFRANPYAFDAKYDENGTPVGLIVDDAESTIEAIARDNIRQLQYAAPVEEFLKTWKWADWNTFRIRCVGKHPVLTTWINGVKICEMDTAKIDWPDYDKNSVSQLLGTKGHIAIEVHDNDPKMGDARWGKGNVCRWRNIYVKEL